ncbi:hypothetical protein LXL04_011198 [Taraxacum kok-saghyz]
MDYEFPTSNNETVMVYSNKEPNRENLDSNHEQEAAMFGNFPLPFHDEISSNTKPQNHHGHRLSTDRSKTPRSSTANDPADQPPPSLATKTVRVRKKRSAGKKDRHSKIHTAQGLRDRRMRLSLHIARKFFGLQDMLGFDKASKTIEWLFSKSKKAIEEVTEGVKSQNTTQSVSNENMIERCQSPLSDCVLDSDIEFNPAASIKGKQLMIQDDEMENWNSRKPTEIDILARESRYKARARARERTRERMMINNFEKSTQMFGVNPNDDYNHQLQLGFSVNPNNNYIKEPSGSPLEYSGTHHLFEQAQSDGITQKTEDYFSGFGYNKSFANPPAGSLNSSNTFLGFLGGWDSENMIRLDSENYGILPNNGSSTGDIHDQSLSSLIFPPTNLMHFQSQHQRD